MKSAQKHTRTLLLAPVTAATSARSAAFDTRGGKYASIEIVLGAKANTNSTNVTLQLAEGDTTSSFVTFNSAYNVTQDATTNGAVGVYHVDLKGRARYLRLTVTPDTHTTNGVIISTAVGILDPEFRNPANSSNASFIVVG